MHECKCKLCRGFCYLKAEPDDPLCEDFVKCPECYVNCNLQEELDRVENLREPELHKKPTRR